MNLKIFLFMSPTVSCVALCESGSFSVGLLKTNIRIRKNKNKKIIFFITIFLENNFLRSLF